MVYQRTLVRNIRCEGVGVHSGKKITLTIKPAVSDSGIIFKRVDIKNNNIIQASYSNVVDFNLCTVLGNTSGVRIGTVEHLLAAFVGCRIDNAIVEVNAEEIPIMDGSSGPFVALIERAGSIVQNTSKKFLKVKKEVIIEEGDKFITLTPSDELEFDISIEFNHPKIGNQRALFNNDKQSFNFDISRARTFGYAKDVEKLRSIGLARGASLDNAIGLDDHSIMNPEGLRYSDEFVKHKILDCIGDLSLAGYGLIAKVTAHKPGHRLNNLILHKLFDNPESFGILKGTNSNAIKEIS
jgi:UDP-3-O-[3-hydroxymyristoyl] N-acetylglucosamine deacetylase